MIESPTGKLKGATFKYIESELYGYGDTLREIAFVRKNLIYCSSQDDENTGGGRRNVPDRPTERIATKLTVHKKLRRLRYSRHPARNSKSDSFVRMQFH
ncbi:hypothetical protein ACUOFC_50725, partial [Escherichia sp. TWPC-MK]